MVQKLSGTSTLVHGFSKLICLTIFLLLPQIVDDGTSLTEIGKQMCNQKNLWLINNNCECL